MKIHELNNYTGGIGENAYLAIDNGTDTAKISAVGLLSETNERLDNLITNGYKIITAVVTPRWTHQTGEAYYATGTVTGLPAGTMPVVALISRNGRYGGDDKDVDIDSWEEVDDSVSIEATTWNGRQENDWRFYIVYATPSQTIEGDAELTDIRVGAAALGGTTYSTAGDAVRGQATALVDMIDSGMNGLKTGLTRLDNLSYDIEDYAMPISWFERGGLNNGVNDTWREGSRARNKSIMSFDSVTAVTVTSGDFGVTYYNNNDQFSSWGGWKSSSDVVTIPKGQKFRLMVSLNRDAPASQVDSLENMVAILRFKTDYNQPHIVQEYGMSFEHGSLERGADDTFNGAARIRNRRIMQFPYSIAVSMRSGVYSIHFYHDDDSFAYSLGWRSTEEYIVPPNAKFRMVLANASGSSAYADIAPLLDNLTITPLRCENSVTPNIVYQSRNVEDTIYPPYSKWYIQAAARNQYDRVRFNVRKTIDGFYFLCHDDTINSEARNADGSTIGTSISANGRTLAELNSYDWGIKYGSYYAGAKVPMLEDALMYSALFNMGVTIEFSSMTGWTDEDTNNVLAMFDKYGATDTLIVIDPQGTNLTFLQKFIDHNKSISVYVGAIQTWWGTSANVANVKALHTNYNKVYVQLYPWGTFPSAEFIALAKANDFTLYNSTVMSKSDLLTVDIFNKGFNLIEANNVFAIKDTVRRWADSLVDA